MSLSVGLISREYPPFFGGGIGTYTDQFSRALAATGARVVVITVSANGERERETRDGVVVERLPFLDGDDWSRPHRRISTPGAVAAFGSFSPVSVFAMQVASALPGLAEEFAFDVVEAPETGALAWFALNERRLGRGGGARVCPAFVTHLHSPTAWIERWDRAVHGGRAQAELKRMEADVVRWADGLVCPSRELAGWAESAFSLPSGAVEVIRHALGDLEARGQRAGSRVGGPRRVLYAGRLEPRKGVDVLLAGFVRAAEAGADLTLDLAGRDIQDVRTGQAFGESCIRRLVPERMRGRVVLHGGLEPSALGALRAAADLAAAPAPCDNFPYSCMEAMACGLPVVAARAGGVAEMITGRGDGLLFEPGDIEGCAAALVGAAAMTDDSLGAMGRAARGRIGEFCRTRTVMAERIAHYERVIHRTREKKSWGLTGRERTTVVTIGGRAEGGLEGAVRAGAAFAHGWVGDGERMRVFGTPTLAGLAIGPREIGPLAVAGALLERLPPEVDRRCPWEVAAALAGAGETGVVVPGCIGEAAGGGGERRWPEVGGETAVSICREVGPALLAGILTERERAGRAEGAEGWEARAKGAEQELARIRASRGWKWLGRVYAVLHRLRGGPGRGSG